MAKVHYGFDAPGIMRNLFLEGTAMIIAGIGVRYIGSNWAIAALSILLLFTGAIFFLLGLSMFVYGIKGKYNVRDYMLSRVNWTGAEQVLDIGTGQGLLMNGAAKWLTTGKAFGIDIWNSEDLSQNTMQKTLQNAELEGVLSKVKVLDEDARKLSFPDESFDVVLSQFCIHNIPDKAEQEKACFEIARVLKPNGKALIGDYIPTTSYRKAFEKAGLTIVSNKPHFAIAYGPTWIVEAIKDSQNNRLTVIDAGPKHHQPQFR